MRRIIFLDIDGVLNSVIYDRQRTDKDGNIDETRMVLLKDLVDSTNAEIVLSSSWRKHWSIDGSECDHIGIELNSTFEKFGLKISDKTPVLSAFDRSIEIQAWLDEHSCEIQTFVIIDDIFGGWGELANNLVKTDSRIGRGLETKHVETAKRILLKMRE